MEIEVVPEPSPDERAALERALADAGGDAASQASEEARGEWWRRGVRENAAEEEDY